MNGASWRKATNDIEAVRAGPSMHEKDLYDHVIL